MAKTIKLPKKVAGYRVPKSMRKSKLLRALLNNPMGRDVLANALTAGAGAAAAVLVQNREEIADGGRRRARRRVSRQPVWPARQRRALLTAMIGRCSGCRSFFSSGGEGAKAPQKRRP